MNISSIGVIGAGAWGTALAITAARAGRQVKLWGRNKDDLDEIAQHQTLTRRFPNLKLSPCPQVAYNVDELASCDALLMVIPAQQVRGFLIEFGPKLRAGMPLVLCSKGIELGTGELLTEVVAEVAPHLAVAVLSGPNFASEVAAGLPAAATIGAADGALAESLAAAMNSAYFRVYVSTDPLGVELGGALKNVVAIATGILQGRGMGENARAAILTRGLAEMSRLAARLGARPETLMGLSGVGDLMLTGSSLQSRNFTLGVALGSGKSVQEVTGGGQKLAEGMATARAALTLAEKLNVDMPLCAAVAGVMEGQHTIDAAIKSLMARPIKPREVELWPTG